MTDVLPIFVFGISFTENKLSPLFIKEIRLFCFNGALIKYCTSSNPVVSASLTNCVYGNIVGVIDKLPFTNKLTDAPSLGLRTNDTK